MRAALLFAITLASAAPVAAQDPPAISIRPFALATGEAFAATDTFNAVFGKKFFPLVGGGVQVVVHDRFFVELSASRLSQTGQRAFINLGKTFQLGIPLTATVQPFEVTGGYRFRLKKTTRVRPYVAAGFGSYGYTETSPFANPGDDVSVRHIGTLVNGGFEVRVHRWVGIAGDVQYTHVPGILGTAGVSQQAKEDDLGGVAVRVKVVIGR